MGIQIENVTQRKISLKMDIPNDSFYLSFTKQIKIKKSNGTNTTATIYNLEKFI